MQHRAGDWRTFRRGCIFLELINWESSAGWKFEKTKAFSLNSQWKHAFQNLKQKAQIPNYARHKKPWKYIGPSNQSLYGDSQLWVMSMVEKIKIVNQDVVSLVCFATKKPSFLSSKRSLPHCCSVLIKAIKHHYYTIPSMFSYHTKSL